MKQSYATLRIFSKDKSVDKISEILNLKPTKYVNKGEISKYPGQNKINQERSTWLYKPSTEASEDVLEHIEAILALLESRAKYISDLDNENTTIDIFCFYASDNGQGGICLSRDVLRRAGKLPVDIIFDLYLSEDKSD